jgi:L-threonylcarbamoyladenylate synthase
VQRIYQAKGRPSHNPLIVHLADTAAAQALARTWPATAENLAARFWPGPLTLVLPKVPTVPDSVTAGLGTVALRVPAHPVALALLRASGLPLAAPSANRSEGVSPTTAAHVLASLGGRIPLILDGGATTVGLESTVIDLTGAVPRLLRPGMISLAMLAAVVGPVQAGPQPGDRSAAPASPGMLDRHYAPRARLMLVESQAGMDDLITRHRATGGTVGAMTLDLVAPGADHAITLSSAPEEYARDLYAALHMLDDCGVTLILLQQPPDDPAWEAIRDRLRRAAHA